MMESKFDLENKHILVTGASRGLGSVCAKALSEAGSKLVLMARSKEQLDNVRNSCFKPENHLVIPADLTERDQLHSGIDAARGFLKHIDAVLHVAGAGLGLKDPLLSAEDLYRLFTLNVGIAADINRLVAPDMMARGCGNLVHVCSIASTEATGSVGYNTVKASLAAYVRSLGREIAGSGVVVTGILPGGFYAPGNAMARFEKSKPEAYKHFIEERLPRKLMGTAEELIPMILLLCSDAASMMGGCLVPIDAGEGKAYVVDE